MRVSRISFKTIQKLNKNGKCESNYSLSKLTTYKVGGLARYFIKICTLESFIKVILYLESKNYPYYIIGNGSNILASDGGYNGMIIKLGGDFDRILINGTAMDCGAGVSLAKAYLYARDNNLSGFECGAGIPASIGGATYMNASAYDFEMAKIVDYVVAYHNGKITYLKNGDCDFGYRYSVFQNDEYIILRIGFKLTKDDQVKIMNRHDQALEKRRLTQPLGYPNAGCVFKKCNGINVSGMLDEMGSKKYTFGGARVSEKHANFIINYDHATAQDIYKLILELKEDFYKKYNIELETELKLIGEFNETNR